MSQKDDFINKTIEFLKTEICPLTDIGECEKVIKNYVEHEDPLRLVDDTFNVMMKCDKDFCVTNRDALKEKLETYLKESTED